MYCSVTGYSHIVASNKSVCRLMVSVGQESGMAGWVFLPQGLRGAAVWTRAVVSSESPRRPGSPLRLTCVFGSRIQVFMGCWLDTLTS